MGLFSNRRIGESGQPVPPPANYQSSMPVQPTPPTVIESRQEVSLSNDLMAKHEESVRKYPRLHLTRGECVLLEVRRHAFGRYSIWFFTVVLVVAILFIIPIYAMNLNSLAGFLGVHVDKLPTVGSLILPVFAIAAVFLLGGLSAVYVYNGNVFYLTNESIIQYAQSSLFSTREQVINLVNVDDVSYRQQGMLQQIFNYGTVRVSTESGEHGDDYVFDYVSKPQLVTRTINDAMEDATGFAVRYRQRQETMPADNSGPEA